MNTGFDRLGLATPLQEFVSRMDFSVPTPIQAKTLPETLAGKNLVGCAQTGSGKTVAYCLPLVQHLMEKPHEMALILVPTRELVKQVGATVEKIVRDIPKLRSAELIGGQSIQHQMKLLKKKPFPRILIATPGRLIDLIERRAVYLKTIRFLVLDEADRMLDMGFAPQLKMIDSRLPGKRERQTLMFSATMPPTVDKLVQHFLCDEVRVTIGNSRGETHHIQQSVISVDPKKKRERLLVELDRRSNALIVFMASKRRTDHLAVYLRRNGHEVSQIHGGRSQSQRNRAIKDFRSGQTRILVASDIAARGLDVPQVETVINFDLPRAPEDYTHRIGRSGRAGKKGEAVSFVARQDRVQWKKIIKVCRLNLGSAMWDSNQEPVEKEPKRKDRDAKWADRTNRPLKNGKENEKKQRSGKRNARKKLNARKRKRNERRGWPKGELLTSGDQKRSPFKRKFKAKRKRKGRFSSKPNQTNRSEPTIGSKRSHFSRRAS